MSKLRILLLSSAVVLLVAGSAFGQPNVCELFQKARGPAAINCGKLTVPAEHGNPAAGKLQISYVVIRASDPAAGAFPLVYISGGPGVSSLSEEDIGFWLDSDHHLERDIILFDQRGIGYSSPLPNIDRELKEIMAKDAGDKEEESLIAELLKNSVHGSGREKVQLQYYNTIQSAQDIGSLMDHLEYKKYNLYGVSYGTRLAREVQDRYPELINAVILNSPNPIRGDFLLDRLKAYTLALERIFAYCENTPGCVMDYPALRERYLDVIQKIGKQPIEINNSGQKFVVNAQDAIYFLRRKLYANDSREAIPKLIVEFENGGGPILQNLVEGAFGPDYNYSMWLAVERYEMYDPANTPEVIDAIYDSLPLLPAKLGIFTAAYITMPGLHGASLPEEAKSYKKSEVPTLITVNQFDPVTPPENGRILMTSLAKGQLFILDEGGHGGGNAECRDKLMANFMDAPGKPLDTSCLNLYTGADKP